MIKTKEGSPYTVEQLRAGGWKDDAMIAAGYAVEVPDEVPPVLVTSSDGKKHAVTFPKPVDNPFGVTRLEQVEHIFNEKSPIKNFPGGYSHAQHILLVAIELLNRSAKK